MRNIAVLVVSCLVSFGLGELAVRIFWPPPQIVTIEKAVDLEVRRKVEMGRTFVKSPRGMDNASGGTDPCGS